MFRRLSRPESLGWFACPWGGVASLWGSAAQVVECIATYLCAWKEALLTRDEFPEFSHLSFASGM